MNKYILILLISLFSILIITASYYVYKHFTTNPPHQSPIKTIKIQYEQPKIITGRLEPQAVYDFSFDSKHGYISDWYVQDNNKVHKNQPIFEYYNPTIEKTISHKQQVLSKITREQENSRDIKQLINLKDEIATLQQNLRTKIIAPFDGILSIKTKNPSPTQSSFAILYQPQYHIRAAIPETDISTLKIGQQLKLHASNTNLPTVEKITAISSFPINYDSSEKQSKYEIKLTSSSKNRLGQHFDIEIPSSTIVIPKTAVLDNKYVLLKKSNKFVKRVIKFSKSGNNNRITVNSGLSPGDIIVQSAKSFKH